MVPFSIIFVGEFCVTIYTYRDQAVMLSIQKVNGVNGQGSQGKIDAPNGVSILLKTDANA